MGRGKLRRLQVETLENRYCLDADLEVLTLVPDESPSPAAQAAQVSGALPAEGEDSPRVIAVSPAAGTTVSLLQTVTIDFSHPMQPASASNRANYLVVVGDTPVPVTAALYQQSGTQYRVTLTLASIGELPVGQVRVSIDGRELRTATGEMLGSSEDKLYVLVDDLDYSGIIGRDANGNLTVLHTTPVDGLDTLPVLDHGDFNGDGFDDLVTVDPEKGDVVFLYGSVSGEFSAPVRFHLPDYAIYSKPAEPIQVVVAHWSDDQYPDLVVLDSGQGYRRLHVLVNDGAGNFTAAPETPIPVNSTTYSKILGVADFTGDGLPDIAVEGPFLANRDASVVIYAKDRFVGYSVAATISTDDPDWSPIAGKVGDFNGDGRPDLIVETSGYYLANPPTLAFLSTPTGLSAPFEMPYDHLGGGPVAIGDFNSDGHLDVVVVHDRYSNSANVHDGSVISVMFGNGQGGFTWEEDQLTDRRGLTLHTAADMNNDGHLDLVMTAAQWVDHPWGFDATPHLSSWVFLGDGAGNFTPASAEPVPINPLDIGNIPNLILSDVNHDGYLDAILANENGSALRVLPNDGTGRLLSGSPQIMGATPKLDSGRRSVYADFNRDGYIDMAMFMPNAPSQIVIFLGNAAGELEPVSTLPSVYASNGWLQVGDMNNDGWFDIVSSFDDKGVGVWLGHGDGQFSLVSGAPFNVSGANYIALNHPSTLVDVNGDGNLDLVAILEIYQGNSIDPGAYVVYFGDGTGNLFYNQNTYISFPSNYFSGYLPVAVRPVVADFDGDGKVDMLLTQVNNSDSQAIPEFVFYRGNGNGTFTPTVVSPIPEHQYDWLVSYTAGDFNGDGHLDVVAIFPGSTSLSLFFGDGQGGFAIAPFAFDSLQAFRFSGDNPYRMFRDVEFGDFDGDGDLDVAVSLKMQYIEPIINVQRLGVFWNNGQGMFSLAQVFDMDGVPFDLQAIPKEPWLLAGTFNYQGNRAPTQMDLSRTTVFANLPGAWVATVSIVDPDPQDTHQWTLSDPRFEVRNGQLYVKNGQSIAAQPGTKIPLTLTATDSGTPAKSLSHTFQLLVQARPAEWTASHQWAADPYDINADGQVTALDLVLIINQLNALGATSVPQSVPGTVAGLFMDINGDNAINSQDAVLLVNSLNALGARSSVAAAGEDTSAFAAESAFDVAGEAADAPTVAAVDSAIAEWLWFEAGEAEQRRKAKSPAASTSS
jgi:hypothetical protein